MTGPTVLVARHGAIAHITLNRPERRNGVTVELCAQLYEALVEIAATDASVLVLRGAGDDFCVGADLAPDAHTTPSHGGSTLPDVMYHSATLLHTMPQVTIAAIDGGCAGAGMGWATACDLRYATPRSRWSTAFLTVGVSGDMGLVWNLTRLLGPTRARELLLFPERFGGDEALALGLVSGLHPPETLHQDVLARAESLARRDPLALRLMKANCVSAETLSIAEYIDVETARHRQTTGRPDMARRMAEGYVRRNQP